VRDHISDMIDSVDFATANSIYGNMVDSCDSFLNTVIPPPVQIIQNLLDEKGKMMIVGSSKSMKTFGAMQMGLSLASGNEFWGLKTKQSRTLFINLEVSRAHAMIRVQKMAQTLGLSESDVADFKLMNARGKRFNVHDPYFMDSGAPSIAVPVLVSSNAIWMRPYSCCLTPRRTSGPWS